MTPGKSSTELAPPEALLRRFIKHMPAAVAMFDTQMRYLQTSDRWLIDAGLEGQSILGRSYYEVQPDRPERWKSAHRRVLAGATETCDRDAVLRADGSSELLQWQLQPWRREDGTVGGLIMFTQIITERVRVEEAYRAREDRFRSAMDHSSIGVAIVELDGRIMEANPALSRILGYTCSELCEMNLFQCTHSEDMTIDIVDMRRLLDDDVESINLQKRFMRRAGDAVWTQASVSLIREITGEHRHLIFQIQDITGRKDEEHASQLTAGKLNLAMDMARLGYWEYDVATSCFTFDDDFYRLLGTTAAREGGRLMSAADYARRFIPSEESIVVAQEIARAVNSTDASYNRRLEHQFRRADRSLGTMAVRFSIQKDTEGRTIRTYGICQDITECKRLQQQHRALESQLRHALQLEAIATLTGGLGHEFNNLLTGIMGHVQLAEMDLPHGPAVRPCLREATNSCRKAGELIARLLAFSHSVEPIRAPVAFLPVIQAAIDQVAVTLPATIELRVELANECPPVRCNAPQIAQTLLHLTANSVYAMAQHGGVIEIRLRHGSPNQQWMDEHPQVDPRHTIQLSIRDTGAGMSRSTMERIFDPFFTTKPPGAAHGLGLPVVHGVMQRHGGAIVVESGQGRGTTIHLFFPEAEQL